MPEDVLAGVIAGIVDAEGPNALELSDHPDLEASLMALAGK
jgi:hypothetical protein